MPADLPRQVRLLALAALFAACSTVALAQPVTTPKVDDKTKTDTKGPGPTELEKALKLFQEGNIGEEFNKSLKKAVEEDPNLGTPRLQFARWLFQANKAQDARVHLEQAIAEASGHPECYLLNASIALAENRITDAILSLERAQQFALNPGWPAGQVKHFNDEALSGLAMAYERRNDWQQVKNYLLQFDRANPSNPNIYLRLARANFFLDQAEEATRYLEKAFEKNPSMDPPELVLAQFWAGRGADQKFKDKAAEAYKVAKEKYNAETAMQKSAVDRERAAKVYKSQAEWLMAQPNMLPAAKELVSTVVKLDPNTRETLGLQGLLLRYEGKPTEAAKMFETALVKSPSFSFAMANLALCLADSPDPKERARGLEQAEQYRKQNEQNPDAYAVLGYCLLKQDPPKLDEADRALGLVLRSGNYPPDTAYYMALLLDKRSKYKEAADLLDQLIKKHPVFIFRTDAQKLLETVTPKVPKEPASKDPVPPKK